MQPKNETKESHSPISTNIEESKKVASDVANDELVKTSLRAGT